MHGIESNEVAKRLERLSSVFRLDSFLDRRFDACSSGMKQRLALARALLHRPRLLLLDEPTRSIDPIESQALHTAMEQLVREENIAVLFVTHDLAEAEKLSRRFLVMHSGRWLSMGAPGSSGATWKKRSYCPLYDWPRAAGRRLGSGTRFGGRPSRRER